MANDPSHIGRVALGEYSSGRENPWGLSGRLSRSALSSERSQVNLGEKG